MAGNAKTLSFECRKAEFGAPVPDLGMTGRSPEPQVEGIRPVFDRARAVLGLTALKCLQLIENARSCQTRTPDGTIKVLGSLGMPCALSLRLGLRCPTHHRLRQSLGRRGGSLTPEARSGDDRSAPATRIPEDPNILASENGSNSNSGSSRGASLTFVGVESASSRIRTRFRQKLP